MSKQPFSKILSAIHGNHKPTPAAIGVKNPILSSGIEVDAMWTQGRACFGGLTAAMAIHQARNSIRDHHREHHQASRHLPPLRSMLVSFVQPVTAPGAVDVTASVLRSGKSVTFAEAKVLQDGACATAIQAAFGEERPTSVDVKHSHLDIMSKDQFPDREQIPSVSFDVHPKIAAMIPKFLSNFDVKFVKERPFPKDPATFGSKKMSVWVKMKDDDNATSAISGDEKCNDPFATERLVALGDVMPPVVFLRYEKVVPQASSLSWNLEIHRDPHEINVTSKTGTKGWFFFDMRLDMAANGYSQQSGVLYDEDGQVVASTRQCMVYFEPKQAPSSPPSSKL